MEINMPVAIVSERKCWNVAVFLVGSPAHL